MASGSSEAAPAAKADTVSPVSVSPISVSSIIERKLPSLDDIVLPAFGNRKSTEDEARMSNILLEGEDPDDEEEYEMLDKEDEQMHEVKDDLTYESVSEKQLKEIGVRLGVTSSEEENEAKKKKRHIRGTVD